ncbi:hypothetical protein ACJX0J_026646, partial [Zea mays]
LDDIVTPLSLQFHAWKILIIDIVRQGSEAQSHIYKNCKVYGLFAEAHPGGSIEDNVYIVLKLDFVFENSRLVSEPI